MNKLLISLLACGVLFSCSATDKEPAEPRANVTEEITDIGRKETGIVQTQALITDIDRSTRQITIKNHDGQESAFIAGPEIRNFAQLEKGDMITVSYIQSIAYELRAPTPEELESPSQVLTSSRRARLGESPSASEGAQIKSVVTIQSINLDAGTVAVRGPRGNSFTVKAKYPERLRSVKPGDTAVVTYTEAVMIEVSN